MPTVREGSEPRHIRCYSQSLIHTLTQITRKSHTNEHSQETIARAMAEEPLLKVTVAVHADDSVVDSAVDAAGGAGCVE